MRPGHTGFLIAIVYLVISGGVLIWRAMFYSHALGDLKAEPGQIADVLSWVALPGVLAFLGGYLLKRFSFRAMIRLSAILVGGGLIWIGLAPSLMGMSPGLLALGLGPILFYPTVSGLKLLQGPRHVAATALGQLRSFGPLASLLASGLLLFVLSGAAFGIVMPAIGLAILVVGILATWGLATDQVAGKHSRLQFKRELLPYYSLHFLAGIRSGVFRAFVIVYLTREIGIEVSTTATLILGASLASLLGYRMIGYLGDRFDKITVLTCLFTVIALNYGGFILFNDSAAMLSVLFIIDSLLFGTSVITDSSLRETGDGTDLAGHLAIGLSMFSLAGVLTPQFGTWLLEVAGIESLFILGALAAVTSLLVARRLLIDQTG